MDKVSEAIIKLLAASTGCGELYNIDLDQSEWEKLYKHAFAHRIDSIILEEASKYGSSICPDLFARWKNNTIIQVLRYTERLYSVRGLLSLLENNNVPIMVLKGLHYKYLYKAPDMRMMSDVDLLTTKGSLQNACDIFQSLGYINIKKNDPKHYVFVKKNSIPIELHFSLFTESKRKIAINFNKEIWESAYYFEKDGMRFLVPSYANQLIYCCIHMTNHFGEGDLVLRQVSDFNLLVKHCSSFIDWDQVLNKAHQYGVGKFMETMLYICNVLFALDIPESIVSRYDKQKEYVDKFIDIILESGYLVGKDGKAFTSRIIASYIDSSGNGLLSKFSYIFPSGEKLKTSYPYVAKCGLLLPVAWVHRLINILLRKDLSFSDKIPDARAVNEYVKIFKWLDIKRNND